LKFFFHSVTETACLSMANFVRQQLTNPSNETFKILLLMTQSWNRRQQSASVIRCRLWRWFLNCMSSSLDWL